MSLKLDTETQTIITQDDMAIEFPTEIFSQMSLQNQGFLLDIHKYINF